MEKSLTPREKELISLLTQKFNIHQGEMSAALVGLLHSTGVSYSDYIHLDVLNNIQHTKTDFDDELIFIVFHQICELYFKLILHELDIITCHQRKEYLVKNNWIKRLGRIVNYFEKLTYSFDIMQPGETGKVNQYFSRKEFLQFRLALTPASGFQTPSLRKIEFYSTDMLQLLHPKVRGHFKNNSDIQALYDNIYWKRGGLTQVAHGEMKSRTLLAFEKQYDHILLKFAEELQNRNLKYIFFDYEPSHSNEKSNLKMVRKNPLIKNLLMEYDLQVNQKWKGVHFQIIKQHMAHEEHGTGGTNWKEYLPTEKQELNFFPDLQ